MTIINHPVGHTSSDTPGQSRAVVQGGFTARMVGGDYELQVLKALAARGLRVLHAKKIKPVAGNNGEALMTEAYRVNDFITPQSMFRGIVVPQLMCDTSCTFSGEEGTQSARDFVVVVDKGRIRHGESRRLVVQVEVKYQSKGGSNDEKAEQTALNMLAGRAPYALILWSGGGAKARMFTAFDECCRNPEGYRELLRRKTYGKQDHPEGPTQLFFSASFEEFFHQMDAIELAEASGRMLTYNEWRANLPSALLDEFVSKRRKLKESATAKDEHTASLF